MVLNRSSGLASTDISGVLFALTGLVVDYSEVERDWPKRYGGGGVRGAGGGGETIEDRSVGTVACAEYFKSLNLHGAICIKRSVRPDGGGGRRGWTRVGGWGGGASFGAVDQ